MEQLPYDIEQKLERLPVIPFDSSEVFQNVLVSPDFDAIYKYYHEHYLPEELKSQQDGYKRAALYLTLTNQDTSVMEDFDQLLYRRPVPSIEEFLEGKFYGAAGNATLYPYWKQRLKDIFRVGSPIRKAIFGGALGVGKSTVARKAFIYVLYRILCLRYARAAFNIDSDSTIASTIISMTLKQVYDTNLLPVVKLMETMPCFQRVERMRSFENFDLSNPRSPIPFSIEKSSATIFFPDNIIVTCGSNQGHFTGYNIVNSFCLTENTQIYTTKGNITIKNLVYRFNKGESFKTLSYSGKETDIINAKETNKVNELIKIWFDDEHYVECTPNHMFVIMNPKPNDKHIKLLHHIPFKEAMYLTEDDEIEEINYEK